MSEQSLERFYDPDFRVMFFDEKPYPKKVRGKVYNDGSHYVAVPYFKNELKRKHRTIRDNDEMREIFDSLYAYCLTEGKNNKETGEFLRDNLYGFFDDENALNEFIAENIKRKALSMHARKRRFRRKANLNKWTYFVTITYSDEKQSEDSFRRKLRKCLCNLHTRRKWRYMGVFERAPETGRLHFHALLYVPDGEMIGTINEKQDYSTKSHKMQTTHENDFFAETFGRNDFEEISPAEMKYGKTLSYLLKYIDKTGERLTYSRGVPSEISKTIERDEIACEMRDFVLKYILFDDVIDWATDVMHCTPSQMVIEELFPHWLN